MSTHPALYNSTDSQQIPPQPTFESLIRMGTDEAARELRVCMPAEIVALHGNHRADVRLLLQVVYYANPDPITLPILPSVPISMPSGAQWSVKYPIDVGDKGWVIFADRALDSWLAGDGKPVVPADLRLHDLTDGIFVPGLLVDSDAAARQDATTDLVLTNGSASVRLERNGTFRVANQGAELVDLVGQTVQQLATLVDTLTQAMTITALGPQALWGPTQVSLGTAKATISTIQTQLNTLKGM